MCLCCAVMWSCDTLLPPKTTQHNIQGILKEGRVALKMWLNEKATPLGTCQQNSDLSRPPPTLELSFGGYNKRVVWVGVEPDGSM